MSQGRSSQASSPSPRGRAQPLHPVIVAAAEGRLPQWAEAVPERREHMRRVADLMGRWAQMLNLSAEDETRWRAGGWLHDALRDADPGRLRAWIDESLRELPDNMVHGPGMAARLREEGVDDEALLLGVAFHTMGHPDLDRMGRCLYLADYLEPAREHHPQRIAALRARMPAEVGAVCREVAAERIRRLLDHRKPIFPQTVAFWNRATRG